MRKSLLAVAAMAAVSLGLAGKASADVVNGSFEDPVVGGAFVTLPAGSSALTDWDIAGSVNVSASIDHIGSYWAAVEGNQSIDLNGSGPDNQRGKISQVITTVVDQWYTISFALAGNPDEAGIKKVLVGAEGIASKEFEFDTTGKDKGSIAGMGWIYQSLNFQATAASTTIYFDAQFPNGQMGAAIDDVSVTAIPLPAAAWAGLALMGALGAARARKSMK